MVCGPIESWDGPNEESAVFFSEIEQDQGGQTVRAGSGPSPTFSPPTGEWEDVGRVQGLQQRDAQAKLRPGPAVARGVAIATRSDGSTAQATHWGPEDVTLV